MSSDNKTYTIKSGGRPKGNPANYDFSSIQTLLDATNPEKVSAAGAAFNNAAKIVAQVAHELYVVGTRLSEKWEGTDADAAQKALGQLYATANELYGTSQQTGQALQTYGSTLNQYKGLKWPPGGASPVEDEARQYAARKVMQSLNQQMDTAWETMPAQVHQNLPNARVRDEQPYSAGPGSDGAHGGSGGVGGGRGSGGLSVPHIPHGGGVGGSSPHLPKSGGKDLPGAGGGNGADLAGLPSAGGGPGPNPPAGNPLPTGGLDGTPSLPHGGLPSGGLGGAPSPGSGLAPGGLFRAGASGAGSSEKTSSPGLSEEESAAASRAAATEEAEASQASRMMGAPGGSAGGAGAQNTERERTTWLAEEAETWGTEEDVIGQALGTHQPGAAANETDTELERKAWLAEDHEVWTGGDYWPSGTLGEMPSQRDEASAEKREEGEELDILEPERLQELLDILIADDEATGGTPNTAGTSTGHLLDELGVDDVNDIDRWLNG